MHPFIKFLPSAFLVLITATPAWALDGEQVAANRLTDLSLEQLMELPVISVSRREEKLARAASAVYVITGQDIARSGATNIPEALRMVPGLHVARKDANHYVVTSRGFNDLPFSDKLLVMVDGRSVHSPTFSQVWWPALNYPLEDIDRIEVILGPGSALWGSNAINGIINIITKQADDTQGGYLQAGGGNQEIRFATLRQGWNTDGGAAMRAYVMGKHTGDGRAVRGEWSSNPRDGGPMNNMAESYQAGLRSDWAADNTDYTISGDVYRNAVGSEGAVFTGVGQSTEHFLYKDVYTGANLLTNIHRIHSDDLSTNLKFYYDYSSIDRIYFKESLQTFDLELESNRQWSVHNTLSLGLTGRYVKSDFTDTVAMSMPDTTFTTYGVFAQNESLLADERIKLIVGAKAEKNSYTDWQLQPNARAAWMGDGWTIWAAASHAVRLTNMANNDVMWNYKSGGYNGQNAVGIITGNPNAKPEEVTSYEAGLRASPSERLVVNVSVYHNEYSNIMDIYDSDRSKAANAVLQAAGHYTYPIYFQNVYSGTTGGTELSIDTKPADNLRFVFALTRSWVAVKPKPAYDDYYDPADWINNATPMQSVKARVSIDMTESLALDMAMYAASSAEGVGGQAYNRFDARLAYSPTENLTLELVGRNLASRWHKEYESQYMEEISWVERDAYFRLTYTY